MKVVYSRRYEIKFDHVWPVQKYPAVLRNALKEKLIDPEDVEYVEAAAQEDIALVHSAEYLGKIKQRSLSSREVARLEIPVTDESVGLYWAFAAGTIQACRRAYEQGVCVHIGGGMHHAFTDYGSGFCMFNDVAIGVRKMQHDGIVKRVMVIDCDVHQGDGTAKIFQADDSVFTFSIHQRDNFPYIKQNSNLDVELSDRTGDDEYLKRLKEHLPSVMTSFRPQLVVYVAGADVYRRDLLGGLGLSISGIEKRDEFVINLAQQNKVPVAVTLAGGYAADWTDTVRIHVNTIRVCIRYC
ncbi:MAG: histone deacetylase [Planctomycetota bacterium]